GARIREVGTTTRTHLADYTRALGPDTGAVLRIHTSNYRVIGFTSAVDVAELTGPCRESGVPLLADLGSGLLGPEPRLPEEPDLGSALRDGADLVIASGDKLLGGPQAGILLGRTEMIAQLARHPMARAVRADKLTLAALEATLTGPPPPVTGAIAPRRWPSRSAGEWSRTTAVSAAGEGPRCRCPVGRSPSRRSWPRRCAPAIPLWSAPCAAGSCCWTCAASRTPPRRSSPAPSRRRASVCASRAGPGTTRTIGDEARDRHRRARRSRQVHPDPRPDRHRTGPVGRGEAAGPDHRPGVRLDRSPLRPGGLLRRRPRA